MITEIKTTITGIFNSKEKVSNLQVSLTLLLIVCLILSNIIVVKSIDLFGLPFLANTASVLVFPITYVLSDVFSEVYGYTWSRKTATWAFLGTALCSLIFTLTIHLPGNAAWTNQEALVTILGNTPRILLASLLAFWFGDFVNDRVFRFMKDKTNENKGFLWRAIGSSLAGKYVDGAIFTFIGLSFLPMSTKLIMIANCPFMQVALELVFFPITSFVAKKVKQAEQLTE